LAYKNNFAKHPCWGGRCGFGMPLGNLTSQFFANVYLNELDYFVKYELKAKYYIRYVDDFVVLHHSQKLLQDYKIQINRFLKEILYIELHPDKSHIIELDNGIGFLGFRLFYHHKLIKKSNSRKFEAKFNRLKILHGEGVISREKAVDSLEGWLAYTAHADTYKYRRHLVRVFNQSFRLNPKVQISNDKKHENFVKKVEISDFPFSSQKTLQLYKKGLNIREIAYARNIKESTVWEHLAKLIEYNQLSVWKVLPREKICSILANIYSNSDRLKAINNRINDNSITFDEIACVLAFVKNKDRKKLKENFSNHEKNFY